MTQLAEAGATIMPASPLLLYKPKTVEELADTVVARILQHLGVEQRWCLNGSFRSRGNERESNHAPQTHIILEMIKVEHTIFALPFALISMLLASRNLPRFAWMAYVYMDNRRNGRGASAARRSTGS